jgi:hypothetical protein
LRRNADVGEVAVAVVANPQANHAAIELPQLTDFERRRLHGSSEYLNLCAAHDDPERDPVGWHQRRIDGVLEFLREFLAQARPVVLWQGDVLHGVLVPRRICGAEVERSQIDDLVRVVILSVKRNADEALLKHVTPADIQFDRAFREVGGIDPDDPVAWLLREMHCARTVLYGGDLPIHGPQLAGGQSLREVDSLCGTRLPCLCSGAAPQQHAGGE